MAQIVEPIFQRTRISLFSALLCLIAPLAVCQPSGLAGVWRGASICTATDSACRNETVVYTLTDVPDHPDEIQIRADKIVDGQTVTMGSGTWHFDRLNATLEWVSPRQTWSLKIAGTRMSGTLTLADGTIFRRMTLLKDR